MFLKNRIREIRKSLGWSQRHLANMVYVSRNTISSIERGEFCLTAVTAGLICRAFNMTFEEVFYFSWDEV